MNGLRIAARSLRQSWGFTLTALLILTIGIGLNTAIFSVVDTIVFRPLPFPHPERLIRVGERLNTFGEVSTSYPNYADWSRESKSISSAAMVNPEDVTMSDGRSAERLPVLNATSGVFDTLDVHPALGRAFTAQEDRKNAPGRVVITNGLWKRRFASDPKVIGRVVTLKGEPFTIVGVMPPDFRFPFVKFDAILPVRRDVADSKRDNHSGESVARLRPGITVAQANAELAAIGRALSAQYPKTNAGWSLFATSLQTYFTKDLSPVMMTLLAAVALVLLLASVNLAGLMLVRAAGRRREIAVRIAIGAGPLAIVRESLREALLIALGGGVLGVAAASWSIGPLLSLVPESANIPAVTIDFRVLLFAAVVTMAATILFTVAPALRSVHVDPNDALKDGGRANTAGVQGNRLRSALVVAEIGLAVVLALAAGLVIKSFGRLMQVDPGFDPKRALTMSLSIDGPAYKEDAAQILFWRRLIENTSQKPAIRRVGIVSFLPMSENDTENSYRLEGQPEPKNSSEVTFADNFVIGGDYFGAMGITLLKGRGFRSTDDEKAPSVVIIDEDFARKNFPNSDPLSHRIIYDKKPWQIIGIVRHVKDFGLDGASREQYYFDYRQDARNFMTITVQPAADTAGAVRAVRDAVNSIDRGVAVNQVRPMAQWLNDSTWRARLSMVLLALFAGVALILAGIGVYGVMAYSVAQRTQEIGIRLALGATPSGVLQLVMGQASLLGLIGIVLGLVVAVPLGGLLSALLFQVSPADAGVLTAVSAALILVALVAGGIPALRAAATDPMQAIRYE
jgi:putative ABC transport system permease protein